MLCIQDGNWIIRIHKTQSDSCSESHTRGIVCRFLELFTHVSVKLCCTATVQGGVARMYAPLILYAIENNFYRLIKGIFNLQRSSQLCKSTEIHRIMDKHFRTIHVNIYHEDDGRSTFSPPPFQRAKLPSNKTLPVIRQKI